MKRITLLTCFMAAGIAGCYAQGTLGKGGKQFNAGLGFSNYGVPIYAGLDFGVHESITIGPKISFRNYNDKYLGTKYSQSLVVVSFNGNYHFNKLFNLPSEWDVYAGASLGYYLWSEGKINGTPYSGAQASSLGFDGQVGGRYFFNKKFAINLELGGGTGTGGNFGITYKL